MKTVSFHKINVIFVFLDPKLVYLTIFKNFWACLTGVWQCVSNVSLNPSIFNQDVIIFKNGLHIWNPRLKITYNSCFLKFLPIFTQINEDITKCPFSWIINDRRINFKNTCQITMPPTNIDLGAKYLSSPIITSDFIINYLILLFVSARCGFILIFNDMSIITWFFKSEVKAKTMRKTTAKFRFNCSTPS